MYNVTTPAANYAWLLVLEYLQNSTLRVQPRGLVCSEGPYSITFLANMATLTIPERKLNYQFAAAEAAWILSGHSRLADLGPHATKWLPYSDDQFRTSGAYGPPFLHQLRYVVDTLIADPYSRQAVMTIWQPNPRASRDIPCTVSLQFVIRDGVLHTYANMRSSDVWLGLPYDMITFTCMAAAVALSLPTRHELGNVTVTCPCGHLYEKDLEKVAHHCLKSSASNKKGQLVLSHFTCVEDFISHLVKVAQGSPTKDLFLC